MAGRIDAVATNKSNLDIKDVDIKFDSLETLLKQNVEQQSRIADSCFVSQCRVQAMLEK